MSRHFAAPVAMIVTWWLVPAALLVATALAAVTGWWLAAIVFACAGVIAAIALGLRGTPVAAVEMEPDQSAAVRAERERAGEVAAVRMLRTERPDLSLADAVRLVRAL